MTRVPPHGTPFRYQGPRRHNRWQPCRCEACRAAYRRQAKEEALRRHRGIPAYENGAVVTAHIEKLLASGWTSQSIADTAEVSVRSVWNWRNGSYSGVQHSQATRVLALRPGDHTPLALTSIGSTRRLQALSAMGWSLTWCVQQLGITRRWGCQIIAGHCPQVSVETAQRIEDLYRRYAMQPGPSRDAKAAARRNNWAPAIAWDDIDDPEALPEVGDTHAVDSPQVAATAAAEEIRYLASCSVSTHEIARRVGRSEPYVRSQLSGRRIPGQLCQEAAA